MTSIYEKPEWSSLPLHDYSLEVIKNGVIVNEISLKDKEFFLLGRQGDIMDIVLEHESISRKHAVLNFHKDGHLFLKDLGSVQGTIINKKPCEKNKFYQLNVGDVLKFGCSTRIYVVKGPDFLEPEEVESEELRRLRERAIEQAEKRKIEAKQLEGVSWGMDFDDHDADEETESTNIQKPMNYDEGKERFRSQGRDKDVKRSFLPEYLRKDQNYDRKYGDKYQADIREEDFKSEKDRQTLEKIRKKEQKIQNMQEENRRIFLKEQNQDDGLTPGQLHAIERNDHAIEQLQKEIDQMIQNHHAKYQTSGEGAVLKRRRSNSSGGGGESDEDMRDDQNEVIDISAQAADISTNWRLKKKLQKINHTISATLQRPSTITNSNTTSNSLDYHQIMQEITELTKKRDGVENKLQQLLLAQKKAEDDARRKSGKEEEEEDEIEKVIRKDLSQEIQQKLKLFTVEKQDYELKLQNLQQLAVMAKPDLKSFVKPPESHHTATDPIVGCEKVISKSGEMVSPSISARHSFRDDDMDNRQQSFEAFQNSIEQEKELNKKDHNLSVSSIISRVSKAKEESDNEKTEERSSSTVLSEKPRVPQGPSKPEAHQTHNFSSTLAADPNRLEGGDYIWLPPKKQKGDGKTSLNERYGY